ncbi:MAG: hypothetical protein J0L75_14735 [Spirochaetes bacterium]|nr:hypothetical protein [Spirochaetota bacterium]
MADCECLPKCIFFNDKMAQRPATAEMMKTQYCKTENGQCARYLVFKAKGGSAVPGDLFPKQVDRARALLAGA